MSNILIPINDRSLIDEYIQVGADEFYMGFYDPAWSEMLGEYAEINRMSGFGRAANRYAFDEVCDIVKEIKNKEKKIFITINSADYTASELKYIEKYIKELAVVQADGVIVSTPETCTLAVKHGIEPVASTMCGIFNSDIAIAFRNLGVKRMILPRDLSIAEIEAIVDKVPDVCFEVFLMRNGCQFSDSHCLGFHKKYGSTCAMLNNAKTKMLARKSDFTSRHNIELNNMVYTKGLHKAGACGLCAIYRFVKMNIHSFKIVGRSEIKNGILEDVKTVKENIEIARCCHTEAEYLEKMIMPSSQFIQCKMGLSCYYPEIRF